MKRAHVSIAKDLNQFRKKFSRLAIRVRAKMDPDDLHDLRVLTRRLRALIWLSRHSRGGPGLGTLRRRVRDLGHVLGEKRTLDVLTQDAARYGLDGDSLKRSNKRTQAQVMASLSRKRLAELDQLMKCAVRKLEKGDGQDLDSAIAELIVRLEELQRLRPRLGQEWHRLRIEVKKIRYASEQLGIQAGDLKKIQDLLGRGHDLGVLMDKLGRHKRIETDMKRIWACTKRAVPSSLSSAEKKLLAFRK